MQQASNAQAQTNQLTTQVNQQRDQSEALHNRTLVAYTKAQNAAYLEKSSFSDANRMLAIMTDFTNRSAGKFLPKYIVTFQ